MVKICTKCKVEKPLAEFHKDKRLKSGLRAACKFCQAERKRKYYEANPAKVAEQNRKYREANHEMERKRVRKYYEANLEKVAERHRKYREANLDKWREWSRKYYEANPEKVVGRNRKYRKANPEKVAEWSRRYYEANQDKVAECRRKWQKANPYRVTANCAKRRAQKIQATPAWANLKAIEAIYASSARISKCLGIEHHVDHIVPLLGKNVCGLHVHNNLQVLPAKLNIAKGNKFTT